MRRFDIKRFCAAFLVLTAVLFGNCVHVFADAERTPAEDIFTEEELSYIKTCGILKVGYVQDRKPVSFKDENGALAGVSREIFDRISQISGLQFEYAAIPEGSVTYADLLAAEFDFVTGVEYNEENQKARGILISDPYISRRKVIVAKEDFSFDENAHCKVAISSGSQTIKKVLSSYYPNYELVDYPSTEACFAAVNKGSADLLIQNQYVVEYWLFKPKYHGLKVIPLAEMEDTLCFSAVTPLERTDTDSDVWQEKELQIGIINKSIAQISDAETAGFIITAVTEYRYRYTYGDFLYQHRFTLTVIGVAGILICILLYINMRIRLRSVRDRADAKAKGDFLSAMSHEIRTPLNGLIGLHDLMSQHLDDKQKMAGYLKQSSSVAQYLLSLVNNILDMSKMQEQMMELEQKPIDLEALVAAVEAMEKSGMADKKLHFRVEAELRFPVVTGDAMRIQQVLVNMLDNARKYTQEGGSVTFTIRQEQVSEREIRTTACVTDNGQGMSEEFQKKIFDPFTQERSTVSHGNQGTGLGMAICSLLAKRMGGDLRVTSKPGEGSTFTFVFAAAPAAFQPDAPAPAENPESAPDGVKPRILIAEDNELNGQILAELLTESGYEVAHATDGKMAVAMFAESGIGAYGVILMDILMPELNGMEATRAIRSLDRPDAGTVKIIACTANSFKEDRDNALQSGMNDFIAKPIDIQLLLKKLESASRL